MLTSLGIALTHGALLGAQLQTLKVGSASATITLEGEERTYTLVTSADLRDNQPPDKRIVISEPSGRPVVRSGSLLFDGLYALATNEAIANSVAEIRDGAYGNNAPVRIEAFQTGESWKYVWTRDLSYSLHLSLAGFNPQRAENSLLFKASALKTGAGKTFPNQIVQDTGSGGSYPVSTDRVVWALGANETLKYLSSDTRREFLEKVYPILCDTIELDRILIRDPVDGLYRGEQSFLDWRQQSYPGWTSDHVLAIAMSKSLSVNAANYFLLNTAADYSRILGHRDREQKYRAWADALRSAIDSRFFDVKAGLYRAYLLSEDGSINSEAARYDLLGISLSILLGVADDSRAQQMIANYPTGPFGPPVVWPQERTVDIYHNQAIWPFVTAYWTKAARQVGNAAAVDAGVRSLYQLAALNLSNMENFDFVTGKAYADDGARKGPTINSRRQLWSIAGYLSMVQDVVFGMETSWDGIRFHPCVTSGMRNGLFGDSDTLELRDIAYHGTRHTVRLNLPPRGAAPQGLLKIIAVTLNGAPATDHFVDVTSLQETNVWEIELGLTTLGAAPSGVRTVDPTDERTIFAPIPPEWVNEGVRIEGSCAVLRYRHSAAGDVLFNIYRDGQLRATNVRTTTWSDAASGDRHSAVHAYAVAAVDSRTGNVSHLTASRSFRDEEDTVTLRAMEMQHRGGNLVAGHHFENWGKADDELRSTSFRVARPGRYTISAEFAHGAGPIDTGITCAVKKLEVRNENSGETVASGYLVMPQSGDWSRWDFSSVIRADLEPATPYSVRLSEDDYSRNMSYLERNARYTAGSGGGDRPYNFVNIATIRVRFLESKRQSVN